MIVNPVLEFRLLVELLEGRDGRHVAVGVRGNGGILGSLRGKPRRHDERALCVRPRSYQALRPLFEVFDHVHDVAEVDDFGGSRLRIIPMPGVPTRRPHPAKPEVAKVIAASTAEVKNRGLRMDQAIGKGELDRARVICPRYRRLPPVPGKKTGKTHSAGPRNTRPGNGPKEMATW